MTIFMDKCGPLMRMFGDELHIEDLNPQVSAKWRLSRAERLSIGWRFIVSAFARAG